MIEPWLNHVKSPIFDSSTCFSSRSKNLVVSLIRSGDQHLAAWGDVEIHWKSRKVFGQKYGDLFDKMVIRQPLEISNPLEITILWFIWQRFGSIDDVYRCKGWDNILSTYKFDIMDIIWIYLDGWQFSEYDWHANIMWDFFCTTFNLKYFDLP
jgi:hypothetical protein